MEINIFILSVFLITYLIILKIIKQNNTIAHEKYNYNIQQHIAKFKQSTHDNPMGNIMLYSAFDEYDKQFDHLQTENQINSNLEYNMYYDLTDIFKKKNNTRPFITMPSTTQPNDKNAYKEFLYDFKDDTCKLNSKNCMYNTNLKQNKSIFFA